MLNEVEQALRSYDVDISTTPDTIIVKPQHFLIPKIFNEIMDKVKVFHGDYLKQDAGGPKWRIPYEKPQPKRLDEIHKEHEKPKVNVASRLDGIISELQRLRQEIGSE